MTVGQWQRRGKYLMAALEPNGGVWGVHLRMTGQFQWHEQPQNPANTRVFASGTPRGRVALCGCAQLRRNVVGASGQAIEEVITGLTRLGPEPFSTDFSASYLKQKLKGSSRPIKTALLDQALVAERATSTRMNPFRIWHRPFTPQGGWSSNNWRGCGMPW